MHIDADIFATLSVGSVAFLAFSTVLVAELVGDKSIYTVTSLSLRYRPGVLFSAMAAAFGAKMLVVILLAGLIAKFDSRWTGAVSAAAFFVSALFIWFKEPPDVSTHRETAVGIWQSAVLCFASLFFAEWGDPGQIAAGAIAATYHAFIAVWIGGTVAMLVKGALALAIGLKLRDRIPQGMLRVVASACCCLMGVLSLFQLMFS